VNELQDKPMAQEEMGVAEAASQAPGQPGATGREAGQGEPAEAIPGPSESVPTQDERTMAALAHASTLLNLVTGFLGIIVALVIWLSYRDRSPYVAFQALQSAVFQLIVLVLTAVGAVVVAIAWTITGLLTAVVIGLCIVPIALALTVVVVALPLAAIIYQLYAAIETYNGRDFEYWWVGNLVRQQGWA